MHTIALRPKGKRSRRKPIPFDACSIIALLGSSERGSESVDSLDGLARPEITLRVVDEKNRAGETTASKDASDSAAALGPPSRTAQALKKMLRSGAKSLGQPRRGRKATPISGSQKAYPLLFACDLRAKTKCELHRENKYTTGSGHSLRSGQDYRENTFRKRHIA